MKHKKEALDIIDKFIACYQLSKDRKKDNTFELWLKTVDIAFQKVEDETVERCAKIADADGVIGQLIAQKIRGGEEPSKIELL